MPWGLVLVGVRIKGHTQGSIKELVRVDGNEGQTCQITLKSGFKKSLKNSWRESFKKNLVFTKTKLSLHCFSCTAFLVLLNRNSLTGGSGRGSRGSAKVKK